ncbi:Glutamate-pyruvate aminotransferase AlaA [Halomonadaceae bacterium LMG 33818]|uniref:pyridoxal phosphate-dependent aminotransferase n=1 Tax=Cernens ardua TaxID=3402176 RepID=UPI003EDC0D00
MKKQITKSKKLEHVSYDIRGPVLEHAKRLENEGQRILKLNIGNPAPFGFETPQEIIQDMMRHLPQAEGYSDSKGIYSARKAVQHESQLKNIKGVDIEDIIIGNGVSELIMMSMQALLDNGDEVLLPSPDYPLWTAATNLAGGKAVHYLCDEEKGWEPDIEDIRAKITPQSKAIVLINPNNPTGAVYSKRILENILQVARENDLIVFSDEIYDKILYDGVKHISTASLADDVLVLTLNGLSKNYRCAGFRAGWLIISGDKSTAGDFIQGLNMLASMRMCSNVPAQYIIQTALGGYQSINDLVLPGGRLLAQRDVAWKKLNEIPGVSCVKPKGALYMFMRLDPEVYDIKDDEQLMLDLLLEEKILLAHGSAFNWAGTDHIRLVTLPQVDVLNEALDRFARFLARRR